MERKFDETNDLNERRFLSIEERLDSRGSEQLAVDPRQAAYDKSRRSMRVWPIEGDDQDTLDAGFRDFAIEALRVPDTVVRRVSIQSIIRVRSAPHNNVYMEILVTFSDAGERDFYFAQARNLAEYRDKDGNPTAGIRLDIPPFLLPTFKLMNDHGFEIRRVHGRETRRYIKFDEERMSLLLEIRLPGQNKWVRIRPEQARSHAEEKDRQDYVAIKRDLLRNP